MKSFLKRSLYVSLLIGATYAAEVPAVEVAGGLNIGVVNAVRSWPVEYTTIEKLFIKAAEGTSLSGVKVKKGRITLPIDFKDQKVNLALSQKGVKMFFNKFLEVLRSVQDFYGEELCTKMSVYKALVEKEILKKATFGGRNLFLIMSRYESNTLSRKEKVVEVTSIKKSKVVFDYSFFSQLWLSIEKVLDNFLAGLGMTEVQIPIFKNSMFGKGKSER